MYEVPVAQDLLKVQHSESNSHVNDLRYLHRHAGHTYGVSVAKDLPKVPTLM